MSGDDEPRSHAGVTRLEHEAGGGDEAQPAAVLLTEQSGVHRREDLTGTTARGRRGPRGVPGEGGERGGLRPGAADVGDQHHPATVAERQHVVGVAADEDPVRAGAVAGGQLHSRNRRQVGR
jgi:hypothetical protein